MTILMQRCGMPVPLRLTNSLEQADGSVNLFTEDAGSCLLFLPVLLPEMYKPQE